RGTAQTILNRNFAVNAEILSSTLFLFRAPFQNAIWYPKIVELCTWHYISYL
ncbi:hypothetical protein B0H65DRAFT_425507, partial [Neurospora tetraspora]